MDNTNNVTGTTPTAGAYGYTAPYGYIPKAPKPGENIGEKIKEIGDALSFIDERLTTIGKEKKEYHQYGNSAKVRERDGAYRDYVCAYTASLRGTRRKRPLKRSMNTLRRARIRLYSETTPMM